MVSVNSVRVTPTKDEVHTIQSLNEGGKEGDYKPRSSTLEVLTLE